MRSCWSVLGIDPTADKRTIKKAYAAKSRDCHPSEHPEAYEELKQAYQEACRYAARQDGTTAKEEAKERAFSQGLEEALKATPQQEESQQQTPPKEKPDYSQFDKTFDGNENHPPLEEEGKTDYRQFETHSKADYSKFEERAGTDYSQFESYREENYRQFEGQSKTDYSQFEQLEFESGHDHMKFVPDEQQQELDFNVESTPLLGETEDEEREVFSSVRKYDNLNWCQRSHIDLFLRQAYAFHRFLVYQDDHWKALCVEIEARYKKAVKDYPDSKGSVFFPDPNVTNFLLGVLPQMKELDYRTWDVLESFMLPKSERERKKKKWADVVTRFQSVRSFKQPGHSYPNYTPTPIPILRRELFPWEQGKSETVPEDKNKKRKARTTRLAFKVVLALMPFIFGSFAHNSSHHATPSSNQEIVNHAIEEYNQEYTQRLQDYQTNPWNLDMSKEPRLSLDYTFMYDGELYFLCYDNGKYYCEQGSGVEEGQRFAYTVEEFIELHPDAEEQVNALIEKRKANEASSQAPSEQPYMSGEEEENGD